MTENGPIAPAAAQPQQISQPNGGDDSNPLRTLCDQLHEQVEAFLAEDFKEETLKNTQKQCQHSLGIIYEALDRYPYPTLSLSYNGGKDCLVLLILYLAALQTHPISSPTTNNNDDENFPRSLPSIYIPPPSPFPSQDAFVATSSAYYHLSLSRHSHPSMKTAFSTYLSPGGGGEKVQAIFVGTRRTDPHGAKLTAFDMTDHGWPSFMRVHPVLEWRYAEVWGFLRWLKAGYCGLYDEGFTSLGGREDTRPNPVLAIRREGEVVGYRPAYELAEDREERLGRE